MPVTQEQVQSAKNVLDTALEAIYKEAVSVSVDGVDENTQLQIKFKLDRHGDSISKSQNIQKLANKLATTFKSKLNFGTSITQLTENADKSRQEWVTNEIEYKKSGDEIIIKVSLHHDGQNINLDKAIQLLTDELQNAHAFQDLRNSGVIKPGENPEILEGITEEGLKELVREAIASAPSNSSVETFASVKETIIEHSPKLMKKISELTASNKALKDKVEELIKQEVKKATEEKTTKTAKTEAKTPEKESWVNKMGYGSNITINNNSPAASSPTTGTQAPAAVDPDSGKKVDFAHGLIKSELETKIEGIKHNVRAEAMAELKSAQDAEAAARSKHNKANAKYESFSDGLDVGKTSAVSLGSALLIGGAMAALTPILPVAAPILAGVLALITVIGVAGTMYINHQQSKDAAEYELKGAKEKHGEAKKALGTAQDKSTETAITKEINDQITELQKSAVVKAEVNAELKGDKQSFVERVEQDRAADAQSTDKGTGQAV